MSRVMLNADVGIANTENLLGDSVELHKTGRWYFLTLTDGTSGEYEISKRYSDFESAHKDYLEIAHCVARNLYSYGYRKQLMK